MRETKHVGSFVGSFEDGRSVIVNVFQEFFGTSSMGGPASRHEGLKELITADGQHLSYVSPGNYVLIATGEAVVSDDPNAP